MKKTIILSLCLLMASCMISLQSVAQSYYEYTIDGKEYKFKNEGVDFSSSVTPANTTIGERHSKELAIYLSADSGVLYSVRVMVKIDVDKEFVEGKYNIAKDLVENNVLPIGYFSVVKNPGTNNAHYYKTNKSIGSIVITKITEEFVEGTFDGEVLLDEIVIDPKTITTLKISNGKFRFPAENLEFFN